MTSFGSDLAHFWPPRRFPFFLVPSFVSLKRGRDGEEGEGERGCLPVCFLLPGWVDARARLRFHHLMRDYEELQKETEAKKRNLQKAKEKKLRLLAEVKFLRKKYKSFLENPSQTTLCRLEEQSHKMSSTCSSNPPAKLPVSDGVLSKGSDHRVVEASKPKASPLLDLNQVSLPGSESNELQMQLQREEKPLNSEQQDHNLAICLDVGKKSNRIGYKRKVRWEDQFTLKRNYCVDT